MIWSASYDAFGRATITSPVATEQAPTIESNLRLPGQYEDSETGLHYNWNRYYDPATGRYITSDPVGLLAGMNRFAYLNGNPMMHSDVSGLCDCKALSEFVDYELNNGKEETLSTYYALNGDLLVPLNEPCMSIYGITDIDWMLRVASFARWSEFEGWLAYRVGKFWWNVIRSFSDVYELEFDSIFDAANENGSMNAYRWVSDDKMNLRTMFRPALDECGYKDKDKEKCQE